MKSSPALKRADTLFSKQIRERDGSCRAAGTNSGPTCNGNTQCAHLVSRRYRALRWSESNAIALCAAHHFFWTVRPLEWEIWVNQFQPTGLTWDELKYLALNDPPEKPADALARMRAV